MSVKVQASPWQLLSDLEKIVIQDRKIALYNSTLIPQLLNDKTYNDLFVIHSGCLGKKENMTRLKKRLHFYDQFDLHAPDNRGYEPVFLAIAAENLQAIEWLAEAGVDLNRFSKLTYLSPVGFAAYAGHYKSLEKMLALGGDPFLTMTKEHGGGQTTWGSTLLHRLGKMGRKNQAEVFKVLAPYYSDIMLVNEDGRNPIEIYEKGSPLAQAFQQEFARRKVELEARLKNLGETGVKAQKKKI